VSFFRDFFSGFVARDNLRDAQHAHKTFTANNYELAPRNKFLFHVYFTLNTEIPGLRSVFGQDEQSTVGLLVKTIDLPSYAIDSDVYNQYNRKRIVQKRIEYNPVEMTFHDDASDLTRRLWYNYFSYYYRDPSQGYGSTGAISEDPGFAYSERDIYSPERKANDWGYYGEGFGPGGELVAKPAFFRDITIYGFNQHRFASYVLINPLITQWNHDRYDYSAGDGIMENRVQVTYESVKYFSGLIGEDGNATTVPGFGNPNHYDKVTSPNARAGGNKTIFGQGGLVDSGLSVVDDLANGDILGAVQTAGRARETFGDADIGNLAKDEATAAAVSVATGVAAGAVGSVTQSIRDSASNRTNQNSSESFNTPAPEGTISTEQGDGTFVRKSSSKGKTESPGATSSLFVTTADISRPNIQGEALEPLPSAQSFPADPLPDIEGEPLPPLSPTNNTEEQ
jgi:hypothetical protein